jgi:outer membrane protein assembly factor BamE (lipoprotein component of BamABCDE complex)
LLPTSLIVGCIATTDTGAFTQKANNQVRKGMSKQEVRNIMGNPFTINKMNSSETWVYSKTNIIKHFTPLGGSAHSSVFVKFNSAGRVSSVDTNESTQSGVFGVSQ